MHRLLGSIIKCTMCTIWLLEWLPKKIHHALASTTAPSCSHLVLGSVVLDARLQHLLLQPLQLRRTRGLGGRSLGGNALAARRGGGGKWYDVMMSMGHAAAHHLLLDTLAGRP